MGVRGRLLRDILSSLNFIKNLSEQQIRASLWRGEGTLYDIELDPRKAQELLVEVCPVGLEILELHIDELYVKIPWSQLGAQSMLVVAHSVNVRLALHTEDEDDWRDTIGTMLRADRQKKQHILYAAPGSLADPAGTLNQLRQRMLHSLQIRADRVRVVVVSQHPRHHSAHRPEEPKGFEEALVVEFEDVFLTPCDTERVPSDQMKNMAVYQSSEHVLQLTRLLKCRTFSVSPPAGPPPCPCATTEFMEAPTTLTCSIVDRSSSDGTRICPVLLSTHLLFDIPNTVRVRCCECQLCAFLAMISDFAQLEEWRLDESVVGERKPELLNTSDVARTFAQGPSHPPRKQSQRTAQSLIRATSASGLFRTPRNSRRSQEASVDAHAGEPLADSIPKTVPEDDQHAGEPGISGAEPDLDESSDCFDDPRGDYEETAHRDDPQGDYEDDDFCDAEDLDYFSIASDLSPMSGSGESPVKSADWFEMMRSWFGKNMATQSCDEETTVDLCTQHSRIAISVASLFFNVAVPTSAGAESLEYSGEGLSICIDAKYEFTEAQRECARRFACPSENRSEHLWPWQLPRRISAATHLSFQQWALSFSATEVVRSLKFEQTDIEPMLVLSMRPRSAPPEILVSKQNGDLTAWPSHLRIAHTLVFTDPRAVAVLADLLKRVKPFLSGKVAPPELVAPGGSQSRQQLFPAQCLAIELCACEFAEPGEASAISTEQRWPWRGKIPHMVVRSDSAFFDLSDILEDHTRQEALRCASKPKLHDDAAVPDGMVSIPKEMFDELVRRAAETTKKDSEVSAAREELQRAYITLATSRPHTNVPARASNPVASDTQSSDEDQDELDQLRQKCLQLELSLQSQALAQRRLETELAHHQVRAQEELRRMVLNRGRAPQV